MTLSAFVEGLPERRGMRGRAVASWIEEGRAAHWAGPEILEASPLRARLAEIGVERLYAHQAEAIELARAGHNVLTVTGVASGKSLCYHVPVLESLAARPTDRALYLFPTKALAHDQLRKLRDLAPELPLRFATYDGDTPVSERAGVRRHAHIVVSNPDMLHLGVLPNHRAWAEFLGHLRWVVVDELHAYTGIFGSHAAHVFRRLRRLCERYGASPRWIASSATVANPREHAEALVGERFDLVDRDGSPAGPKRWCIWSTSDPNDPEEPGGGCHGEAARLVAGLVSEGIRTIAFVRSRRAAETLLLRSRAYLLARSPKRAGALLSYRGGYLPEERRSIERQLATGELLGVWATTALELGVDIGGLDACVMVGYPGSISGLRQQAGRVGRSGRESAVFLLPDASTLDQWIARRPDHLIGRQPERAVADPGNRFVAGSHLLCAADELPLAEAELDRWWPETKDARELLGLLAEAGYVEKRGAWHARPGLEPAAQVSLRSSVGPGWRIVEGPSERLVGTVDAATALQQVHPRAVYLHLGEKWKVTECDFERRLARVQPGEKDEGLTRPRVSFATAVDAEHVGRALGPARLAFADVTMQSRVIGYWQLGEFGKQEQAIDLELPEERIETVGIVLSFAPIEGEESLVGRLAAHGRDPLGALHALEHAMIAVMPLLVACAPQDVAGYSTLLDPFTGGATVTIADAHAGGVGIAEAAYERVDELLARTREAIVECGCEDGCPACVQAPSCGSDNKPLDKAGAVEVLDLLLGLGD